MPTVIVPAGFIMGPEFGSDEPADRLPRHYEVHFGGDPQDLSEQEFAVWALGFAEPARHADLQVTRKCILELLDGLLIDNPDHVIGQLLDRGLLLEFDPLDGDLEEPFSQLLLFPHGHGLGSSKANPDQYRIGCAGHPIAWVSSNVYQLWSYSMTFPSLWDACVDMADAARSAPTGPDELLDIDAESLAREVGTAIPLLVSVGAAFLDPRELEWPDEQALAGP